MKQSTSLLVKAGVYIIFGFFTLIIIISFGMPDFVSKIGMNNSIGLIVNGERISRIDVARYINRDLADKRNEADDSARQQSYNKLINMKVVAQFASKCGIDVTDSQAKEEVRRLFVDKEGVYNPEYLTNYLKGSGLNLKNFIGSIKENMLINEFNTLITYGSGVSQDEVAFTNYINNNPYQIKYAILSNDELKKRNEALAAVTDAEVDQALSKKKKEELSDPVSDRNLVKASLETEKLSKIKADIVAKLNDLSSQGQSFEKALSVLSVTSGTSAEFRLGDPISDEKNAEINLSSLNENDLFRNEFLSVKEGAASKAIDTEEGIIVFTPIKKAKTAPTPDVAAYMGQGEYFLQWMKYSYFNQEMINPFYEKSKIVRLVNFGQQ